MPLSEPVYRVLRQLPSGGRELKEGRLYRPPHWAVQGLTMLGSFVGGPVLGIAVARLLGDLSEDAQLLFGGSLLVIFVGGHALWLARVAAGALLKLPGLLFRIAFRRRTSGAEATAHVASDPRLALALKCQRAASCFAGMGALVGLALGGLSLFFDGSMPAAARFGLATASCVAWGLSLAWLGRRGFLPFPEPGEA